MKHIRALCVEFFQLGALLAILMILPFLLSLHANADPLTTAARPSVHAEQSLMLGLARAGHRIVAVGEHGIILYSDNAGQRWAQAKVPVSVTLTSVNFPDPQHGFAVGHDGVILASQDAGQSWVKQLDGNALNQMMVAEAQSSVDAARRALANAKDRNLAQIAVDSAQDRLADVLAGAKYGPSRPLLAVWFSNVKSGYAVGAYGQAVHTEDGGIHWASFAARINNRDGLHFNSITGDSRGTLLIAGEGGKVYRSTDAGNTWKTFNTGYSGQLYGVLAPNANTFVAFGFGGHILRSEDSGNQWNLLAPTIDKRLVSGTTLSTGEIRLEASDGTQLSSKDQGRSFTIIGKSLGIQLASAQWLNEGTHTSVMVLAGENGVHAMASGK